MQYLQAYLALYPTKADFLIDTSVDILLLVILLL